MSYLSRYVCFGALPLLDHISQHFHHGNGLILCKALVFEPLDKLQCIEMVVAPLSRRGCEWFPVSCRGL